MKEVKNIELVEKIRELKKLKNAIILSHYYQTSDIQDIADFIGDSLALSQKAADNSADIILFAGVRFMAETAKILSPAKKVLIPDMNAGCSLADSCDPVRFKEFIRNNPGRTVVTYVNTNIDIKVLSDISCTSSNAVQIIESLPAEEKIIFGPDRNLVSYIKEMTGRDIAIWDGACHVHEDFSVEAILDLKKQYPEAKLIVHPECEPPVRMMADFTGSTAALLKFTSIDSSDEFIVATEPGIIYQMEKKNPMKKFIPAPSKNSARGCSECNFMKMITIEKIYECLKKEEPEIVIDKEVLLKARKPIVRMMKISEKIGL
ncbi:MAG: quinolinate synthase NadA [Bacteroidales bacterium]|nr:quinolinate synthase NadA [Bacteroidales bacterium]